MAEHDVKDLPLARAGKLKIERAEQPMPVLPQMWQRFHEPPVQEGYLASWTHGT